jgi:hypothetical protein
VIRDISCGSATYEAQCRDRKVGGSQREWLHPVALPDRKPRLMPCQSGSKPTMIMALTAQCLPSVPAEVSRRRELPGQEEGRSRLARSLEQNPTRSSAQERRRE